MYTLYLMLFSAGYLVCVLPLAVSLASPTSLTQHVCSFIRFFTHPATLARHGKSKDEQGLVLILEELSFLEDTEIDG